MARLQMIQKSFHPRMEQELPGLGGVAQVAHCLPSMHEALGSIPNIAGEKRKVNPQPGIPGTSGWYHSKVKAAAGLPESRVCTPALCM
jgi:hypothetical protein